MLLNTGHRKSDGFTKTKPPKPKQKTPVYYPGVYVVSRKLSNNISKLGEASGQGGIYKRVISQYKICYPDTQKEFFMKYLILTERKTVQVPNAKKTKMIEKSYAQMMEQMLHKSIGKSPVIKDIYSNEYIYTSTTEIEKNMDKVFQNPHIKPFYLRVLKFVENGFHEYDKEKGKFGEDVLDFKQLRKKYTSPEISAVDTLVHSLPLSNQSNNTDYIKEGITEFERLMGVDENKIRRGTRIRKKNSKYDSE